MPGRCTVLPCRGRLLQFWFLGFGTTWCTSLEIELYTLTLAPTVSVTAYFLRNANSILQALHYMALQKKM